MDLPIPFLLLVQGINAVLNWSLMLFQRAHLTSSFMGAFCASLTLIDTLFTAAMLLIYGLQDFSLVGVRFTGHHICVLVQILGFVYGLLQWPVFLGAGLDHYGSLLVGPKPPQQTRKLKYAACASLLWVCALLWVLLAPGFDPALEDLPHLLLDRCQTPRACTSIQIAVALLLTLGCVTLCARIPADQHKTMKDETRPSGQRFLQHEPLRIRVLGQALGTFTRTWAAFLLLVLVILVLQIDLPSHTTMNVPWLCFLNSFLISLSLCKHFHQLKSNKLSVLTDGFCQWDFT